ncbi:hypothetical protein HK101_003190 [Irineochytrium annulatum]|nr:hypothetical protein HK101_003190 [Irineochytrium annulatum]
MITPWLIIAIRSQEQCKSLPLEKLYLRLERIETEEQREMEDIRRRYAAEMGDVQRQIAGDPLAYNNRRERPKY